MWFKNTVETFKRQGPFTRWGNGCGNGKKMLPLQLDSIVTNGLVHTAAAASK